MKIEIFNYSSYKKDYVHIAFGLIPGITINYRNVILFSKCHYFSIHVYWLFWSIQIKFDIK